MELQNDFEAGGEHVSLGKSNQQENSTIEDQDAAKILDDNKLDGRILNSKGELTKMSFGNIIKSIPGLLLGVLLFPFLCISSGLINCQPRRWKQKNCNLEWDNCHIFCPLIDSCDLDH